MKSFILAVVGLFLFTSIQAARPEGTTITITVPGVATKVTQDNTWNTTTIECDPNPNQTCYKQVITTGRFIGEYWEVETADGGNIAEGYLEGYSVTTHADGSSTHNIDLE